MELSEASAVLNCFNSWKVAIGQQSGFLGRRCSSGVALAEPLLSSREATRSARRLKLAATPALLEPDNKG